MNKSLRGVIGDFEDLLTAAKWKEQVLQEKLAKLETRVKEHEAARKPSWHNHFQASILMKTPPRAFPSSARRLEK